VEQTNLRIQMWRFAKELLRDRRRTTGRLDSRFTGIDEDAAGESYEYDPSYSNIYGAYAAMLNDYVRRELEFESDLPYEILTGRVHPWKYKPYENRYVNVAETLRDAMTRNPSLKVFVANGYYDLATPYWATWYTFSHLGLDETLRDHVTMAFYEAGHMMYIHKPSLVQMRADLIAFMESALAE
jgi:carboxypeptidase C (cathepsin A)